MTKNNVREPLFHITKRAASGRARPIVVRLIAIVVGLLLGLCFVSIYTKQNPFFLLKTMFFGAFGGEIFVWSLFQELAILLLISLAVVPAFKMKFWNIGADGQTLVGCLAAAIAIYYFNDALPNWALLIVMALMSMLAGVVCAVIPALFKAKWNTNETLFTLMMNYIAICLVEFFKMTWFPSGQNMFSKFYRKFGNFPILGNKYVVILLVAGILTVLMSLYLGKTKHGFEVSLVGESINTSKYVGINVKKVIIRTMILSGVICGLAGFLLVSAKDHTITSTMVSGRGFTAIIVVWLAKFNPIFMVLTAFLVVFLSQGTAQIGATIGVTDGSLPKIITALVFFFVIGCEFFINYKIVFRNHKHKGDSPFGTPTEPPAPEPVPVEEPTETTDAPTEANGAPTSEAEAEGGEAL